jgi:ubiquinone biosynthesis protein
LIHGARLVRRAFARLDALSLDLARDVGAVRRDARALATGVRSSARTIRLATPRALAIARAGAELAARARWLQLAALARGQTGLSDDDHKQLAALAASHAGTLRGGVAKLAQLASCRPDLVGPIWAGALAALQDDVAPVPSAAIRAAIERELGATIESRFATFDDVPLAAASLAQVHAATLLDGTPVVVKVQVPGIGDVVAADIAALSILAASAPAIPGVDVVAVAGELERALREELDYEAEAAALAKFAAASGSASLRTPRGIASHSTRTVLTMTRIHGQRLATFLDRANPDERDRVLTALVSEVAEAVLVRGLVHADPHPGNYLVTPEGELALVDFGCTLELSSSERAAYKRLVGAILGRDREAAARELGALGFVARDMAELVALASSMVETFRPEATTDAIDWQAAFDAQLARARALGEISIPRSFVLLGRVLVAVAGLLASYRPRIALHTLIAPRLAVQ